MSLFQLLDNFPQCCIYALVDEANKAMYTCYAEVAPIQQLAKTMTELKKGIHDNRSLQDAYNRSSLEIRVLREYESPPPLESLYKADMLALMGSLGYSDMRGIKIPKYKIKTRVLSDYKGHWNGQPLVYVIAKCASPDYIVLGIFDAMLDADEWISLTFPGQVDIVPSFALNERTREYHSRYGYKLLRAVREY